ncbi:hypothetical protein [Streptomyces phaeofaciens]|uniref:hypothetical protein n=1 Tax=Streptomyces phaeofaciens TaxID=68254 RepID=UPI0036A4B14D
MNLSRTTALAVTTVVAAAITTLTGCGSGDGHAGRTAAAAVTPAPARQAAASAPGDTVVSRAYRAAPYAWATRHGSRIGIYGLDLHGRGFTRGSTVRLALFRDSGPRGIPVWTKDATARRIVGRPGGAFDVSTGLLDCTAYRYPKDSTLMVWDIATDTWSNKVRVATGCNTTLG